MAGPINDEALEYFAAKSGSITGVAAEKLEAWKQDAADISSDIMKTASFNRFQAAYGLTDEQAKTTVESLVFGLGHDAKKVIQGHPQGLSGNITRTDANGNKTTTTKEQYATDIMSHVGIQTENVLDWKQIKERSKPKDALTLTSAGLDIKTEIAAEIIQPTQVVEPVELSRKEERQLRREERREAREERREERHDARQERREDRLDNVIERGNNIERSLSLYNRIADKMDPEEALEVGRKIQEQINDMSNYDKADYKREIEKFQEEMKEQQSRSR